MKIFGYVRPATVPEAIAAAAAPGSAYLAAGTNLVDLMKGGAVRPDRLVDITRLTGLDRVERLVDGGMRIGALVRNADLAYDADFARAYPAVAEAILSGASPQVRNAATLGGNLMQRTRCSYFYDVASACNRREPGSGCDARQGENRLHAVLGWSEQCIATHPSDVSVPLVALDAVVEIEGKAGRREIALEDLQRLPGDTPERETALEPGDLIVALRLPAEAARFAGHARYLKLRERTSFAFAVVSAAAALDLDGGAIRSARLALGGVAARPWRARAAEQALAGANAGATAFRRAADVALADAKPSGDNAFKIELAKRIVERALALAAARRPERLPALPASPFSSIPKALHHA
jgi:xanthine dehydrogenase YagS FAD-binding subunit